MSAPEDKDVGLQCCLVSFVGVPLLLGLVWLLERIGWLN